jgi:hypothetical protein
MMGVVAVLSAIGFFVTLPAVFIGPRAVNVPIGFMLVFGFSLLALANGVP